MQTTLPPYPLSTSAESPEPRRRKRGRAALVIVMVLAAVAAVAAAVTTVVSAIDSANAPVITTVAASEHNTGVPAGTRLRVHEGNLYIHTDGAVVSNLDLRGTINVDARNVVIKDSIIRGGPAPDHASCLINSGSTRTRNLLIEDSEIAPTYVNANVNDLCGAHFTALRLNSHGGVDTADILGNDVTIADSWLHDTTYFAHDPNHGNGESHNDTIQIMAGHHLRILGNTLDGGQNSAIQVTQVVGSVGDVLIADNEAGGGTCTFRFDDSPGNGLAGVVVRDNRFLADQTIRGCVVITTTRVQLSLENNHWPGGVVPVTTVTTPAH